MACAANSREGATWTREAYVWQRTLSRPVAAALERSHGVLDRYHFLAAEVAWRNGEMEVWRPDRDWSGLAVAGQRLGLVLRVGHFDGRFAADGPATKALVDLARSLIREARDAGVPPAELQIDFDCAESELGGYRIWVQAIAAAVQPVPLVITALPAWLNQRTAFSDLVGAVDGFVLQVHSLEKPSSAEEPFTLCDAERAWAWMIEAGQFGVPFRVALPTYGYLLNFHADGRFASLAAETLARGPPTGGHQRHVLADPVEMAALVRRLADVRGRPPHCTGVVWFRLPVEGDALNWTWTTFARVVRGETPVERLTASAIKVAPELTEVVVENTGETTVALADTVAIRWSSPAMLIAADGYEGFAVTSTIGRKELLVRPFGETANRLLAPGERRRMAWLRFRDAAELTVQMAR